MKQTLDMIVPGKVWTIQQIHTENRFSERLKDYGIVPGTKVICQYCSPGGHLVALECRGAVVALRREDLRGITVEA